MSNTEIDKKIEEFFFDPSKTPEEYKILYSCNNPGEIIRFSTLYLARRDIFYCFGFNPEIRQMIYTGSSFGTAYFAGIWLIYETVITLASSIDIEKVEFYKKYLQFKNPNNIVALDKLRQAITHFKYSLKIRDRSSLWQFSLNPNSRYLIGKDKESNYPSNNFVVNPFIFHQRLEEAIMSLKERLLNRRYKKLRGSFNNNVRRKHWVIIFLDKPQYEKEFPWWFAYQGKIWPK